MMALLDIKGRAEVLTVVTAADFAPIFEFVGTVFF